MGLAGARLARDVLILRRQGDETLRSEVAKLGMVRSRTLQDCETLWSEAVNQVLHVNGGWPWYELPKSGSAGGRLVGGGWGPLQFLWNFFLAWRRERAVPSRVSPRDSLSPPPSPPYQSSLKGRLLLGLLPRGVSQGAPGSTRINGEPRGSQRPGGESPTLGEIPGHPKFFLHTFASPRPPLSTSIKGRLLLGFVSRG